MQLLLQPEGSSLCGQTCVAMLAGVTLQEAIYAVGHHRGTRWHQLQNALRKLGIEADEKLTKTKRYEDLPSLCVLRVYWDRKQSHWIIRDGDRVLDPAFGIGIAERLPFDRSPNTRVTSFAEVFQQPGLRGDGEK